MSRPLFDAMWEVGERITRAEHVLLCLDFDGTLARIVDDPATVFPSPQVQRLLLSLSRQRGVSLAILSGRERGDLQTRIGIEGLIYGGNHGLEISGPGCHFIEPTAAACAETLRGLATDLASRLQPLTGAWVEDKGLTLSVHYRQTAAADAEEVRRIVHGLLASTNHPFHLTTGDKVYEVRPRVYWNKGAAVVWIMEQLDQPDVLPVYLGDDTTDEDAFAAMPDGITVKVNSGAETAAQYRLESPAEVRRFLEWVDGLLRQKHACAATC